MRSRYTSKVVAYSFLLAAGLLFAFGPMAEAQSKQYKRPKSKSGSKENKPKSSDKLDISDLENKYWAPKDTDFSVVQNRSYTKEKRVSISATGGILVNDSYSTGTNIGLSANYFFSERMGVEVGYVSTDSKNNEMTDTFKTQNGILPDHSKVKAWYGVGFSWVPFYAKMSVLGKKIIYFDMAFTPNIGMTTYEQQIDDVGGGNQTSTALTLGLDITQYFFFTRNFALRADLKNKWFEEDVLGYSNVNRGIKIRTNTNNTTQFMFGVTYFF